MKQAIIIKVSEKIKQFDHLVICEEVGQISSLLAKYFLLY